MVFFLRSIVHRRATCLELCSTTKNGCNFKHTFIFKCTLRFQVLLHDLCTNAYKNTMGFISILHISHALWTLLFYATSVHLYTKQGVVPPKSNKWNNVHNQPTMVQKANLMKIQQISQFLDVCWVLNPFQDFFNKKYVRLAFNLHSKWQMMRLLTILVGQSARQFGCQNVISTCKVRTCRYENNM